MSNIKVNWYDEDIQSSKLIDRQTTGDIEEISDEK